MHTYIHAYLLTYIHTYLPTYMHTYIHAYLLTYIHTYLPTYMHTYIHAYLLTYIHTYLPTYMHTYIHIYIPTNWRGLHINLQYCFSCRDGLKRARKEDNNDLAKDLIFTAGARVRKYTFYSSSVHLETLELDLLSRNID